MKIDIIEVGPRDGLQNEKTPIPTQAKISFINHLVKAGLHEIEVTSFVSPKWVPQLADALEVIASLPKGHLFSALVPNQVGLQRALTTSIDRIALFTAASDAFTLKNIVAPSGSVGLQIGAMMGPADLLFLSLFFVAIHRFGLRGAATLKWMVPVLIAYMFIVLLFGDVPLGPFSLGALPVLLPIGTVILLVNWRCFDLKRDEIVGTVLAAMLGLGLAGYGIYRASLVSKAKPVATSKKASAPSISKPQDSPAPKAQD